MKLSMMKKINKNIFIFFLFSFLLSQDYSLMNIYWEPEFPDKGSEITIYVDVSETEFFRYAYQMNIHLSTDSENYSTYAMSRDYSKGMFMWIYKYDINEDIYFQIDNNDGFNDINVKMIPLSDFDPFSAVKESLLLKDYTKAITLLEEVTNKYPGKEVAAEAQFMIAEIYLNDFKEYEMASEYYHNIVQDYSKSFNSVKKSMFTLGYIYANYLDYYSDAIATYKSFKNTYPYDPLLPSIDYELEILSSVDKTIEALLNSSK